MKVKEKNELRVIFSSKALATGKEMLYGSLMRSIVSYEFTFYIY